MRAVSAFILCASVLADVMTKYNPIDGTSLGFAYQDLNGLVFKQTATPVSYVCDGQPRYVYLSVTTFPGLANLLNQFRTHLTNPWAAIAIGPVSFWWDFNCTSGGWVLWFGDYNQQATVRLPAWFTTINSTGTELSPDLVSSMEWVQMDWIGQIVANQWWWDSHKGDYDSTNYYYTERFGFPGGSLSAWQFEDVFTTTNAYWAQYFGATGPVYQVSVAGKGAKGGAGPAAKANAAAATPAAIVGPSGGSNKKATIAGTIAGVVGVGAVGALLFRRRKPRTPKSMTQKLAATAPRLQDGPTMVATV